MPTLTRSHSRGWLISNDNMRRGAYLVLSIHDDDVAIVDVRYKFATHDAP